MRCLKRKKKSFSHDSMHNLTVGRKKMMRPQEEILAGSFFCLENLMLTHFFSSMLLLRCKRRSIKELVEKKVSLVALWMNKKNELKTTNRAY